MPQLIRTPEQIFREEGKDIYMIKFADDEPESEARDEIIQWLTDQLPGIRFESLAPSEHSGWLCGYFGALRVDFSESSLATFCARWETAEGKSTDPRFQCYLMPYQRWHDKITHYMPTFDRPTSVGISRWWDTPQGIACHQITSKEAKMNKRDRHPCLHRDLWFNLVQSSPALATVNPEDLTYGDIVKDDNGCWVMTYSDSYQHRLSDQRKAEILTWFNLPRDTQVIDDGW